MTTIAFNKNLESDKIRHGLMVVCGRQYHVLDYKQHRIIIQNITKELTSHIICSIIYINEVLLVSSVLSSLGPMFLLWPGLRSDGPPEAEKVSPWCDDVVQKMLLLWLTKYPVCPVKWEKIMCYSNFKPYLEMLGDASLASQTLSSFSLSSQNKDL